MYRVCHHSNFAHALLIKSSVVAPHLNNELFGVITCALNDLNNFILKWYWTCIIKLNFYFVDLDEDYKNREIHNIAKSSLQTISEAYMYSFQNKQKKKKTSQKMNSSKVNHVLPTNIISKKSISPQSLNYQDVMRIQKTAGNQAVSQLFNQDLQSSTETPIAKNQVIQRMIQHSNHNLSEKTQIVQRQSGLSEKQETDIMGKSTNNTTVIQRVKLSSLWKSPSNSTPEVIRTQETNLDEGEFEPETIFDSELDNMLEVTQEDTMLDALKVLYNKGYVSIDIFISKINSKGILITKEAFISSYRIEDYPLDVQEVIAVLGDSGVPFIAIATHIPEIVDGVKRARNAPDDNEKLQIKTALIESISGQVAGTAGAVAAIATLAGGVAVAGAAGVAAAPAAVVAGAVATGRLGNDAITAHQCINKLKSIKGNLTGENQQMAEIMIRELTETERNNAGKSVATASGTLAAGAGVAAFAGLTVMTAGAAAAIAGVGGGVYLLIRGREAYRNRGEISFSTNECAKTLYREYLEGGEAREQSLQLLDAIGISSDDFEGLSEQDAISLIKEKM